MTSQAVPAALRRNQLALLTDAGWARLVALAAAGPERECIALWAAGQWPLVVTRQATAGGKSVALGLPAPAGFSRIRLALQVLPEEICCFDAFPRMADIVGQLAPDFAVRWASLAQQLGLLGCEARVYGSHGWQWLTGLAYLRPSSDIDLTMPVTSCEAADAVCAKLAAFEAAEPRIDGELVFADGSAAAWREWQRWRAGEVRQLMLRRLRDVNLVDDLAWLARVPAC